MTTNRFKDFGSGVSETVKEPLLFKLHGEEFKCMPNIQGKIMLELVADSSSDDPAVSARTLTTFFNKVLLKEDLEKFNTLLDSQEKIVSVETLSEISAWLIEEYTARPNQQPEA